MPLEAACYSLFLVLKGCSMKLWIKATWGPVGKTSLNQHGEQVVGHLCPCLVAFLLLMIIKLKFTNI